MIAVNLRFASCNESVVSPPGADTTSHAFTWTVTRLGDGSSYLRDVAIINDTLAYAVGVIYLKNDSSGQLDPQPYNIVRWDGASWLPFRVMFPLCDQNGNQTGSGPFEGVSILAFTPNDIWIACGGSLVHWNGTTYTPICMPLGYGQRSFTKLWGQGGRMYLAGTDGFVAQYIGGSWQQLLSGTTLDVRDIYGAYDMQTGSLEIIAVASKQYQSLERKILRIRDLTVEALPDSPITQPLTSCWFVPGVRYFVAGSGIYEKTSLDDPLWQHGSRDIATYYIEAIRGAASNDLVAVGDFGEVLHYSGRTWKSYLGQTHIASGAYYAVAMKGNTVLAVGEDSPRAVILMGFRFPM